MSFEGAFRYRLIQEYYPSDFVKLQESVRRGRWRPAGAMLDAPDTNLPSVESLIRHVLYGNDYFERQFGRRCADIFLPDCFGFAWSLPTIAAHCGLRGFSTQKLVKWIRPATIPFDLGLWEGPDGSRIVAVLDPGGYGQPLREDLSRSATWTERLEAKRSRGGLAVGYKYFGVGDRGGAPDATSLDWLERSLAGDGAIEVIHTGSDQLFRDLCAEDRLRLPVHRGDLLLPTHGTGCWTSQAILKKWNRNCELLAGAAESAALAADWLGGPVVPRRELNAEWSRFLWHQMHDDITGTSSPEAYRVSWNDLALSQNRLATILESSVRAVARGLDTRTPGIPLVLFNGLGRAREDLVDAWVEFDSPAPPAITVLDSCGREVPSQQLERAGNRVRIVFPARLPSIGFAVYEVATGTTAPQTNPELEVSAKHLENRKYRIRIADSGAIESLYDKQLERELLAAPMDLVLLPDRSTRWPAWELRYEDLLADEASLDGPAAIRVVEHGPVRVKVEITRRSGRSTFRQQISLACGRIGDRLEISNDVDWRSPGALLKARFPFAIESATATYDMGLGTVTRQVNRPEQYEVPAHEWADLSADGWGVSILARDKYGWDRPESATLRLSLLRSPKALRRFAHQAVQDFGTHRFGYAVFSHSGAPGAETVARGAAFNSPLLPFQARPHEGILGREFSLFELEGAGSHLMALKKAESSDRWLARIREVRGRDSGPTTLSAPVPLLEASQVDGCERAETPLAVPGGRLTVELPCFAPRSYLLRPQEPQDPLPALQIQTASVELPLDTPATSVQGSGGADLDGRGHSIPGELFPARVEVGELVFALGPTTPGTPNAMSCRGQTLYLPTGGFERLHLLAMSTEPGGSEAALRWSNHDSSGPAGGSSTAVRVPYYSGYIGQWKLFSSRFSFLLRRWKPGFLEKTPVAWVAGHRHDRTGRDQVYEYCYLFLVELAIPPGARALELPKAPAIKIFSALASIGDRYAIAAGTELYQ